MAGFLGHLVPPPLVRSSSSDPEDPEDHRRNSQNLHGRIGGGASTSDSQSAPGSVEAYSASPTFQKVAVNLAFVHEH